MKPNYRRCISCRKVGLKNEFWRIVRVFPSGQVQLDEGMGRSAYICPHMGCLSAAQKKTNSGDRYMHQCQKHCIKHCGSAYPKVISQIKSSINCLGGHPQGNCADSRTPSAIATSSIMLVFNAKIVIGCLANRSLNT